MTVPRQVDAASVSDEVSEARKLALDLLQERAPEATICPSEVARCLVAGSDGDWRDAMPIVHRAVDALVDAGAIGLSWKGSALHARSGPYRIARPR